LSNKTDNINCPNCKEDVPKTLYCLNCGYPLYKLEQPVKLEKKEDELIIQSEQQEVDMSVEIGLPEQEEEEEPLKVLEEEAIEIVEELTDEESAPESEPEIETTIEVEEEPGLVESVQFQEAESEEAFEAIPEIEEVDESELIEKPITEPELMVDIDTQFETNLITPLEGESYVMSDVKVDFAPDPLTKEVMESLAKNITLKIRIVRLLRENLVKEETFNKLFDSYVEQGKLWLGRREEIIKRLKSDIERMEQELVTARKDFELLEIRKSIGDASEEEYNVKAPAYKWDIENLDKEIKNTRGGIQYVVNLKGLIPEEEINELQSMANSDYSELDNIDGISNDTIVRMKETLTEALKSVES
jgi:hypothetical protein